MSGKLCEICGRELTAWNRNIGSQKCSECARGNSPQAKREENFDSFDEHASLTERGISERPVSATVGRLIAGALIVDTTTYIGALVPMAQNHSARTNGLAVRGPTVPQETIAMKTKRFLRTIICRGSNVASGPRNEGQRRKGQGQPILFRRPSLSFPVMFLCLVALVSLGAGPCWAYTTLYPHHDWTLRTSSPQSVTGYVHLIWGGDSRQFSYTLNGDIDGNSFGIYHLRVAKASASSSFKVQIIHKSGAETVLAEWSNFSGLPPGWWCAITATTSSGVNPSASAGDEIILRITAYGSYNDHTAIMIEGNASQQNIRIPDPCVAAISVSPSDREVGPEAGSTTFEVSNTGSGTMNWTASVISGADWLSVTSGASGTNSGTIGASFSQNTGEQPRVGTIQVSAPGAIGSPEDVTVTQEGAQILSVTPHNRDVGVSAGSTTFEVSNTGSGTMNWTASVISGADWLSVTSGASGTNSGTIGASFSQNTGEQPRVGTIQVSAPGAIGSPEDVTVTQEGAQILSVTPHNRDVGVSAGSTTFEVSNTGSGTMNWTASVISGADWLSITSGASGTNSGTIGASFSQNTGEQPRVGTIQVSAPGAIGSPEDVTVTQEGAGDAPDADFSASPTSGTRPLTVEFTDLSTGMIDRWLWEFGDGYTSTEKNPSHTYYFTGDFTVTLTVTGPAGEDDSDPSVIDVDQAAGARKYDIDGIKVKYTMPTCFACYNELDGTLLISIWGDEPGVLNVIAGNNAAAQWDSRCDVYIDAPQSSLKKIDFKGKPNMEFYVCGQVAYVKNLKLKHGHVGDTLYYGPDFGLGSAADDPPKNILIKWGATTAPALGVSYPGAPADLLPELKLKPFDLLLDEKLDEYDADEFDTDEGYDDFHEDIDDGDDDFDDEDVLSESKGQDSAMAGAAISVTKAAYTREIEGIKVRYSKPGCEADYDPGTGMLRIQISESDGNLTVTCGEDAPLYWGDYCDIYIDAPGISIKTINLKGTPDCKLYVCGEVGYVKNFKLKYGCVGDTDYYGEDYGLFQEEPIELPNKIQIKWGWTTAPLLGVSY